MNVSIVIDGKQFPVGYAVYKDIHGRFPDEERYAKVIDRLVKGGTEEMWVEAAMRQELLDDTFFFLVEHGTSDVFDILLSRKPALRLLTLPLLLSKKDQFTAFTYSQLAETSDRYQQISPEEIGSIISKSNRIDVYYALARSRRTPQLILEHIPAEGNTELAYLVSKNMRAFHLETVSRDRNNTQKSV